MIDPERIVEGRFLPRDLPQQESLDAPGYVEYFSVCLPIANEELNGPNQSIWLQWLHHQSEVHGFEKALKWCLDSCPDPETSLEFGALALPFWIRTSELTETYPRLKWILERDTKQTPCWARACILNAVANIGLKLGLGHPLASYREAEEIGRRLEDDSIIAESLLGLGEVVYEGSELDRARALFDESLVLFKVLESKHGEARALKGLCIVEYQQGNYEQANDHLSKCLRIAKASGDRAISADCYMELGNIAYRNGDYARATKCLEKARKKIEPLADRFREANIRLNLGAVEQRLGNDDVCISQTQQAAQIYDDINLPKHSAYARLNIGAGWANLGEFQLAFDSFSESLRSLRYSNTFDIHGAAFIFSEFARLGARVGNFNSTAVLCGVAANLRRSNNAQVCPSDEKEFVEIIDTARQHMSDEDFARHMSVGEAMS